MAEIGFVGVATRASSVHRALACWEPWLGARYSLRGIDLPVGAPDSRYLDLLDRLRGDPELAGAVITTHKVRLFQAGQARFDWLDPLAIACEEVNAIRRHHDGSLLGWARDPVSVGRVADRIWPRGSGQVVCLGCGGSGVALAHHLLTTRDSIQFVCADRDPQAMARLARVAGHPVTGHLGEGPWDELVSGALPGSLIVNATGMGKDRPGSPTSDGLTFPEGSVVWELNYRGELRFLDQALGQARARALEVHDGWELFGHGWAAALSVVLDLPDDAELGERLLAAVGHLRPSRGPGASA